MYAEESRIFGISLPDDPEEPFDSAVKVFQDLRIGLAQNVIPYRSYRFEKEFILAREKTIDGSDRDRAFARYGTDIHGADPFLPYKSAAVIQDILS